MAENRDIATGIDDREMRLEEMTAVLMSMAALDFSHRIEMTGTDTALDTLAAGLNMLAEELEATTVSRSYLDSILQAMPDMLMVVGPDSVIRTANQATGKALGYPADRITGMRTDVIMFTGGTPDHVLPLSGFPACPLQQVWYRRQDGTLFPVAFSCAVLEGNDDHGYTCILNARDVSEQKAAVDALTVSENRFKALFNNISSGVAVYDVRDGGKRFVIRDLNRAAERIDCVLRHDLVGRDVRDVYPGIEEMGLLEVFGRVWRSGAPEHFPAVIYKDDRIQGWRENYIYRLPSGEIVAVYDDVTEKKKAEARLRHTMKELARSNRELTDFAHIASHDLKEPLRKVITFGERIKTKADSMDDRSRDYLDRMLHAAGRMTGLLDGLLEYARVTTKGQPFEDTDLARIAREVLSDLEVRVQETGADVQVSDLPVIQADPLQMRQLLQNLIGNALKYHRPDVAPVVRITSRVEDGNLVVTVEDNGIGIAPEDREKAFGVFQRLVGKNEFEGTGVGLSICKKIVERHAGTIHIRDAGKSGAVFEITLPYREAAA